jgi:hypothetical protein
MPSETKRTELPIAPGLKEQADRRLAAPRTGAPTSGWRRTWTSPRGWS